MESDLDPGSCTAPEISRMGCSTTLAADGLGRLCSGEGRHTGEEEGLCGEEEAGSGVAGPPAAGSWREAAWDGGGDAGTRAWRRRARCSAPMAAADLEVGATGDEASAAGRRACGDVAARERCRRQREATGLLGSGEVVARTGGRRRGGAAAWGQGRPP